MDQIRKQVWTQVWNREFGQKENWFDIERERASVRWRKIKDLVSRTFGSFSRLRVIEIGSGRGIYGLLMSLEGAQVTLLDQSELALQKAQELYSEWGQDFQACVGDVFQLPSDLIGKFDIAMSFGLAEHFKPPKRFEVFQSHLKLLKAGGLLIASVPNSAFVPYRIGKFLLEAFRKWSFGLEIPFSRQELRATAKKLGLTHWQIIGSGLMGDFANFWLIQRLLHLPYYLWENLWSIVNGRSKGSILPLKDRFRYFPLDFESWLDDYWGYALVLVGNLPS